MQRVVTDVLWYECVSVCLSVRLLACWSQPIEMSFVVWTLASRRNNVLGGGPGSPGAILGASPGNCKV